MNLVLVFPKQSYLLEFCILNMINLHSFRPNLPLHHWSQMISSVTFSVLSFGQSEGLHLQRNQLDPQLRRHQKQILRLALEALSISCCEQLLMGHQTRVSLIWEEEDVRQGRSHSQCLQVIVLLIVCLSVFSPSGLTGTSLADRQRRHMSSQLGDREKILFLETKTQRLKLIHLNCFHDGCVSKHQTCIKLNMCASLGTFM